MYYFVYRIFNTEFKMPVIFSLFLFAFKLKNHSIKYFINSKVNTASKML